MVYMFPPRLVDVEAASDLQSSVSRVKSVTIHLDAIPRGVWTWHEKQRPSCDVVVEVPDLVPLLRALPSHLPSLGMIWRGGELSSHISDMLIHAPLASLHSLAITTFDIDLPAVSKAMIPVIESNKLANLKTLTIKAGNGYEMSPLSRLLVLLATRTNLPNLISLDLEGLWEPSWPHAQAVWDRRAAMWCLSDGNHQLDIIPFQRWHLSGMGEDTWNAVRHFILKQDPTWNYTLMGAHLLVIICNRIETEINYTFERLGRFLMSWMSICLVSKGYRCFQMLICFHCGGQFSKTVPEQAEPQLYKRWRMA